MIKTIIVDKSETDAARELASQFENGSGMFTTALYDTTGNVTHYISSGIIEGDLLQALLARYYVSNDDPHEIINSLNLTLNYDEQS